MYKVAEKFLNFTQGFGVREIFAREQVECLCKQPLLHAAICGGQNPEEQKRDLLLIILICWHRPGPRFAVGAPAHTPPMLQHLMRFNAVMQQKT